jgi:hypothetical protein
MPQVTIIEDETRTVEATVDGDGVLIEPGRLGDALGWELKAEGLCRGDVCVPVRDPAGLRPADAGRLDLAAVAAALGRPVVVDAQAGLAAVALPAEQRRQALESLQAPPFALHDLDGVTHQLSEWRGRKKLLVAFASW